MDLQALYQSPQDVSFLHSRYYVEGCLLGACACPEIPLPDVWLPWVIKEHNQIQNAAQADNITEQLFVYFKHCLAEMNNESLSLPHYAQYKPNADNSDPFRQWCQGILLAHSAREAVWQSAWQKMQKQDPDKAPQMAKDLKHCLMMFTTFADPSQAIREANNDVDLAPKLPQIANSMASSLRQYVSLSGTLASYLPNQFETFVQN
ncbi:MAG: UPF0149 family protein [Glaciecola sp.]